MGIITTMIVDAMITRIVATMQTPYLESDDTRVNYVGVGKLQDNYNRYGISVLVRPATEAEQHQINNDSYIKTPVTLIGGGAPTVFYKRRFTLELHMFWAGVDNDPTKDGFRESMEKANIVLSRLRSGIMTMSWALGVDDIGETVIMPPIVFREYAEEGGSKRGQNNYRGDVFIDWFTMFRPI